MPTSLPPRSYQGCAIRSQVSCTTLEGAGRLAPGREPSTCQIRTRKPMTSSGGSTWVRKPRAACFASSCNRCGTAAGASPIGSTMSVVLMGVLSSGGLDVLDVQAVEVLLRVGRVEDLAVEELFDPARGGGGDVRGGHAQFLGG